MIRSCPWVNGFVYDHRLTPNAHLAKGWLRLTDNIRVELASRFSTAYATITAPRLCHECNSMNSGVSGNNFLLMREENVGTSRPYKKALVNTRNCKLISVQKERQPCRGKQDINKFFVPERGIFCKLARRDCYLERQFDLATYSSSLPFTSLSCCTWRQQPSLRLSLNVDVAPAAKLCRQLLSCAMLNNSIDGEKNKTNLLQARLLIQ